MIQNDLLKREEWVLFAIMIVIMILVFTIPLLLNLVNFLGYRIPQKNIRLDYIKGCLWALFLGLTILIWPVRSKDKNALLWIWGAKCFVMLGLMLFYEYSYRIDGTAYFGIARYDTSKWAEMNLVGPTLPVGVITWLHQHSILDSYHAVKVSFGMIGLVAIYIFYRAAAAFLQQEKIRLLYILALFPSILFWSSILGKEPLVLMGISIYCYGVIKWNRSGAIRHIVIIFTGIVLAAYIRIWLGFILTLPILVLLFMRMKNGVLKIISTVFMITALFVFADKAREYLRFHSIEGLLHTMTVTMGSFNKGGSAVIKVDALSFNGIWDIVIFIPRGMFTALFRPLPGEVNNIFGILAGIEGAFLLILSVLAMKRMKRRDLSNPIIIWAILLITIWAGAYGFVSYNFGTVCRYRLQILPVFLGLLLYFNRNRRFDNAKKSA